MRETVLYIAVSLDGFIADAEGGVGWLSGQDASYQGDYGYGNFAETVDTVLMGYRTYDQITSELSPGIWPYQDMQSFVFTHRELPAQGRITFTSQPPTTLIEALKCQPGKKIWICGGADLIRQMMAADLIDEYHLTIMPVLLGRGLRLFQDNENTVRLRLTAIKSENGTIDCIYKKQ